MTAEPEQANRKVDQDLVRGIGFNVSPFTKLTNGRHPAFRSELRSRYKMIRIWSEISLVCLIRSLNVAGPCDVLSAWLAPHERPEKRLIYCQLETKEISEQTGVSVKSLQSRCSLQNSQRTTYQMQTASNKSLDTRLRLLLICFRHCFHSL